METGPPFNVAIQATWRPGRLQGKDSIFIAQLFYDAESLSGPGDRTRDLPPCSQALYRLNKSCRGERVIIAELHARAKRTRVSGAP